MNFRKLNAGWLLLLLLESAYFLFLGATHRLVRGHDGFQYFTFQYYFLNNAVISGEIPQWMPFMCHGTIANLWYAVQASPLQQLFLLIGTSLKEINFLSLFYANFFFDEMVLATGIWLLSGKYFCHRGARFFSTVAALGSSIWMDQPWYNLHFYNALPLIFYFGHCFLDERQWRYFFLAGNLLAVQMLGNLPYFLPVQAFVIAVYFAAFMSIRRETLKDWNLNASFILRGLVVVACLAFIFASMYALLKFGIEDVVNYNFGRTTQGKTSVVSFLSYASNLSYKSWTELLLGVSPGMDYTLYVGVLSLVFLLPALVSSRRQERWALVLLIVALLVLTKSAYFAYLIQFFWPMMNFFRHLSLINPMIRLFLCLLAGFGFEALVAGGISERMRRCMALLLGGIFLLHVACLARTTWFADHAKFLTGPRLYFCSAALDPQWFIPCLVFSALCAALGALALRADFRKSQRAIQFLLALQLLDLGSYKIFTTLEKTFVLNDVQYALNRFQPMPYAMRRTDRYLENPRVKPIWQDLLALKERQQNYSSVYWTTESYVFMDPLASIYRTDLWMLPFDDLLRALWKQKLRDLEHFPPGISDSRILEFPSDSEACLSVAGHYQKIQLFDGAFVVPHEEDLAKSMVSDTFNAQSLLVTSLPKNAPALPAWNPGASVSDHRLKGSCSVREFTANTLTLAVRVDPASHPISPWLFCSEVWDRGWKASVDGKSVPLYKAFLAYRAIPIHEGLNLIHFRYEKIPVTWLTYGFCVNATFWVVGICFLECAF